MTRPEDRTPDPEETVSLESAPIPAALRRSGKPFLLEQVQGPGAPRQFVLELSEIVIGRSLQAHISVDSSLISRRHLALRRSGPEYSCVDLGSKNGFYVNGVRAHSVVLQDGDTVQLGDIIMIYREGG